MASASSILFDNIFSTSSSASSAGGRTSYDSYTPSYSSRYGTSSSSYSSNPSSGYSSSYSSSYGSSGLGASSRYSSYTSPTSSYDKYSYLDDRPSLRNSSSSSSSSSSYRPLITTSYRPNRFTSSTAESSSLDPVRNYSTSAYITPANTYDSYGRELSNYDKWKLSSGREIASSSTLASTSSAGASSRQEDSVAAATTTPRRVRFARLSSREDMGASSSSSLTERKRETTVAPTSSISTLDDSAPYKSAASRAYSVAPTTGGRKISANFSSSSRGSTLSSLPFGVQSKLSGYTLRDVRGDGGCYYRCLSLYFSGSEENYMKYRREVLAYIRENLDNYSSMIKSETSSTNDYFSRKTRADRQDWAETTEIIATCCVYDINVHVLALVPGRGRSWEWLHFDPSIGTGRPSHATRDIYLYNQGSVHFMLATPN